MIGWLIYSAVDVEKNKYYIQMYKDKFKEHFIEIKLVIVEELENMEQYVKCNKVDFAINRSRNHIMGELLEQKGVRVFIRECKTTRLMLKSEFWRLLWLLILRKNLKNFICLRINQRL
jgi:hypothetical protein